MAAVAVSVRGAPSPSSAAPSSQATSPPSSRPPSSLGSSANAAGLGCAANSPATSPSASSDNGSHGAAGTARRGSRAALKRGMEPTSTVSETIPEDGPPTSHVGADSFSWSSASPPSATIPPGGVHMQHLDHDNLLGPRRPRAHTTGTLASAVTLSTDDAASQVFYTSAPWFPLTTTPQPSQSPTRGRSSTSSSSTMIMTPLDAFQNPICSPEHANDHLNGFQRSAKVGEDAHNSASVLGAGRPRADTLGHLVQGQTSNNWRTSQPATSPQNEYSHAGLDSGSSEPQTPAKRGWQHAPPFHPSGTVEAVPSQTTSSALRMSSITPSLRPLSKVNTDLRDSSHANDYTYYSQSATAQSANSALVNDPHSHATDIYSNRGPSSLESNPMFTGPQNAVANSNPAAPYTIPEPHPPPSALAASRTITSHAPVASTDNQANSARSSNATNRPDGAAEEISTIFVVGFPDDMNEREFQNMFTFSTGFEAATLKVPASTIAAREREVTAAVVAAATMGAQSPMGKLGPYPLVGAPHGGLVLDQFGIPVPVPLQPTLDTLGYDEAFAQMALESQLGTFRTNPSTGATQMDGALMGVVGLPSTRKQIIGFAKFKSRADARHAKEVLSGRKVDAEKGNILKAEMAKKNLHTKRGLSHDIASNPSNTFMNAPSASVAVAPLATQGLGVIPLGTGIGYANMGHSLSPQGMVFPGIPMMAGPQSGSGPGVSLAIAPPSVFQAGTSMRPEANNNAPLGLVRPRDVEIESPAEREQHRMLTQYARNAAAFDAFHSIPPSSSIGGARRMTGSQESISNGLGGPFSPLTSSSADMGSRLHADAPPFASPKSLTSNLSPNTTMTPISAVGSGGGFGAGAGAGAGSNSSGSSSPMVHASLGKSLLQQLDESDTLSDGYGCQSDTPTNATYPRSLGLGEGMSLYGSSVLSPTAPGFSQAMSNRIVTSSPPNVNVGAGGPFSLSSSPPPGISSTIYSSSRNFNPADMNPAISTLYVGGLPTVLPAFPGPLSAVHLEDALRNLFMKCVGFKRLSFRAKSQQPMCFVEFENVGFATQAMQELYGNVLGGLLPQGIRLAYSRNALGVRSGSSSQGPGSPTMTSSRGFGSSDSLFSLDTHDTRSPGSMSTLLNGSGGNQFLSNSMDSLSSLSLTPPGGGGGGNTFSIAFSPFSVE